MTEASPTHSADDRFNLQRFIRAQDGIYPQALSEIRAGQKSSHWMWFIFPQYDGLGFSPTARAFAIKTVDEARAYLDHALLGTRLIECATAVAAVKAKTAVAIFGSTDALKLRSSVTLFAIVSSRPSIFRQILDEYFNGEPDEQTLNLLSISRETWQRE